MPTYEYACDKCGHTFEKFQSMKDDALTVCPKDLCCKKTWGKGKVKRLMGAGAGLIFKGSGFYITDYRSEGYKQSAKADTASSVGSSPPAVSKPAETKPAAKSKAAKPDKS
jgi:putative FmdB family regulatory protein